MSVLAATSSASTSAALPPWTTCRSSPRRPHLLDHRAERRRQDDPVQPHLRPLSAGRQGCIRFDGQDVTGSSRTSSHAPGCRAPSRTCRSSFASRVLENVMVGRHLHEPQGHPGTRPAAAVGAPRQSRVCREGARVHRVRRPWRTHRTYSRRAALRCAEASGDCARARHRAQGAAPRRACRRLQFRGDRGDRRADPADRAQGHHGRAGRARHEARHEDLGPRPRARSRPQAGRGNRRGGAQPIRM